MSGYIASLKRAFLSKKYLLSVTGIVIMCFISTKDYMSVGDVESAFVVELLIYLSMFKKIIVFFSSFSFVTVYCQDYNSKYLNPVIVRSGKKTYILSNIISCVLSSFTSTFSGIMIFFFAISLKFPMTLGTEYYYCNMVIHEPLLHVLIMTSIFSLYCAVWTVAGLAFSAILPDKYVALGTPLIFGYLLEEITYRSYPFLDLYRLSHGLTAIDGSGWLNYAYAIMVFLVLIVLFGVVFSYFVQRRIRK